MKEKSSLDSKQAWSQGSYLDNDLSNVEVCDNVLGDMKICPICGKEFLPSPLHMYKVKRNYSTKNTEIFKYSKSRLLCSYTCYNKADPNLKKKKSKFKENDVY